MAKLKIKYEYGLKSLDGTEIDGLCNKIRKEIKINAKLSLKDRAITIGHELIHYLGYRVTNFRASIIIDEILDYSNFLIEKESLISLISHKCGLKTVLRKIRNKISMYDYVIKTYPKHMLKVIFELKRKNSLKNGLEWLRESSLSPKTIKGEKMETKNVKTSLNEVSPVSKASGETDFKSLEIKSQNNVKGGEKSMNSFEAFRMSQKAKIEARLQTFRLKQKILRRKSTDSIDLAKLRPLGLIAEYKNNFELEIPFYVESKENWETLMQKRQNFKMIQGKPYVKNPNW